MANKPRKPYGLKAAGTRLWESITAEFDFTAEPGKLAILEHACRVADTIALFEREAAKSPLTVKGSANQVVVNPLRSEARFQRGLLSQLLRSLALPETDEAVAEKSASVSRRRADAGRHRQGTLNVVDQ